MFVGLGIKLAAIDQNRRARSSKPRGWRGLAELVVTLTILLEVPVQELFDQLKILGA